MTKDECIKVASEVTEKCNAVAEALMALNKAIAGAKLDTVKNFCVADLKYGYLNNEGKVKTVTAEQAFASLKMNAAKAELNRMETTLGTIRQDVLDSIAALANA